MIFPEQIRAARALLDWSTHILAEKTGLTVNGINKIERGHVHAQRDTLEKIRSVLETAGIEFLPGAGIRRKHEMVTVFEGPDFRRNLISYCFEILKDRGGEILAAHENEEAAIEEVGTDFLTEQLKERWAANIKHKFLVRDSDPGLIPPYSGYRVLPDKYFASSPLHIVGPVVAMSSHKYAPKAVIIHNERIANSLTHLFNYIWDHAEKVTPRTGSPYDELAKKFSPGEEP